MKTRNVVYTCITAGYDVLPVVQPWPGWDFACLTDGTARPRGPWNLRRWTAAEMTMPMSPKERACWGMILPHKWLRDYDYSVYCDANQALTGNPETLCAGAGWPAIGIPKHYARDCVYEELVACVARGCDEKAARRQFERYGVLGMPAHAGLWQTKFILRRHNGPDVEAFGEAWWRAFVSAEVKRDQPALAHAVWETGRNLPDLSSDLVPQYFQEGQHNA